MNSNILIGAIAGDVIGSKYEFCPHRGTDIKLFLTDSKFADDAIMMDAIVEWLLTGYDLVETFQKWGRKYPFAGYGQKFSIWLINPDSQPYNRWGGTGVPCV